MKEIMQERNAADVFFASMGGNLSAATGALGAVAQRAKAGLEYYGITRSFGEMFFDLVYLRTRKIGRPYRRSVLRPRLAF